ncbi:MAG: hypothetical protein ACD_76C00122G0004 [uncultured bacterium]|nr:MAG: hypothetical protein ACD_76C00122G0004 [uncultured bacterium]HBD05321.1 hypothetical protein [Candidatus Uhrbacteria bacterium]
MAILSLSYWLSKFPPSMGLREAIIIFSAFAILFIVGGVMRTVIMRSSFDRHMLRALHRLSGLCITMGLLGLLETFFAFESIPFFGARYWYLIWLLAFLIWLGFVLHFMFFTVRDLRRNDVERLRREKYLPKPKRA